MYALIVLLLLAQFITGCSSGRKGAFIEIGGGMARSVVDEEWTVDTEEWPGILNWGDPSQLSSESHDAIVTKVSPAMGWKIGYGVTEQLLLSLSVYGPLPGPGLKLGNGPESGIGGLGITIFHKKTAPSLFFDVVLPMYLYGSRVGIGASVGVGYEFISNWSIEADFIFGTQSINDSHYSDGYIFGDSSYTTVKGKREGYTLGFNIRYRFAIPDIPKLSFDNTSYEAPSIDYIWD